MFSLIESKREIAKSQRKLEATIKRTLKRNTVKNIGHLGGTVFDAKVATDGHYWFWSSDHRHPDVPNPRRLNWFGLLRDDSSLHISVEVNTAYEGRNDQVAGFFARDTVTDILYLLHSGRIGGGQKGIGKAAFLAWGGLRLIEVVDSTGGIREGVPVMPVESKGSTRSAVRYIDKVASFKRAVRTGSLDTPEFRKKKKELEDFYAEARGRRKGRRSARIDYLSRHGDVVDALHAWRNSTPLPNRGRIGKNIYIDLGVAVGDNLTEVFEVKTSASRTDVYSAIGQVMVHGTGNNCRRVIVLPHENSLATDLKETLDRLGITLLTFELTDDNATII